jgi:hypothetical protein
MRHSVFTAMLAVCAISASCSSPTSPGTPEAFTIGLSQSAEYHELSVTFKEVVVDSRCPEEAFVLCIQGGDAFLRLGAATPRSAQQYDVQVLDPNRRRFVHARYEVEVTGLEPKPFISGPIDPQDYRLSLLIK